MKREVRKLEPGSEGWKSKMKTVISSPLNLLAAKRMRGDEAAQIRRQRTVHNIVGYRYNFILDVT